METKTEKITITDVDSFESKGKTLYKIRTADGRVGMSSDNLTEFIAKPTELIVKPGNEYKGVQQYFFNLPKENGAGSKKSFPARDYTFEKRKTALECSVSMVVSGKIGISQLEQCRDKFFEYLNTK